MVRTKASVNAVKVSAAKAPRKYSAPTGRSSMATSSSSPSVKKDKPIGGNPACQRPTPNWQKPIGSFFTSVPRQVTEEAVHASEDGKKSKPNDETEKFVTNTEQCDDNKENENPQETKVIEEDDSQPGPSNRITRNPTAKRRRVVIESDSEEEEECQKSDGCLVDVEDEIVAS